MILDTAADAILTIDEAGLIRDFNKAAERIFGYAARDVIGRSIEMLMPEDMAKRHQGFIDTNRRTGINRIIGIGREVCGKRADGFACWRTTRPTSFHCMPPTLPSSISRRPACRSLGMHPAS